MINSMEDVSDMVLDAIADIISVEQCQFCANEGRCEFEMYEPMAVDDYTCACYQEAER